MTNQNQYIAEYYQIIFSNKIAAPHSQLFNAILDYLLGYRELYQDRDLKLTMAQNLEFLKLRLSEMESEYNFSTPVEEFQSTVKYFDDFETIAAVL